MTMMPSSSLPHRCTPLSTTVVTASTLLDKWHPDDDSGYSLFLHASAPEADHFLSSAADLHRAMLFFASDETKAHHAHGLVQAQALLDMAMQRLQLELRLLLSAQGRDNHDAHCRLHGVVEAMMAAGYGKECTSTFKERRRAALAATLRRLHTVVPLHKLTWEEVDDNIQSWLTAARVAFSSLFPAEKELCDSVFACNQSVGDAMLAAIANEQATNLLSVAENAVARARRAPERLFRVLDVHDALNDLLPAIVSVFGDRSEVAKRACSALLKAGEAARGALARLEAAIKKEQSKATAAGAGAEGAVHPLTRYVMNYLVVLADYDAALDRIYYNSNNNKQAAGSRLVEVVMRTIEAKAGSYREAGLRRLFLANNTHYVARKLAGIGRVGEAQEYREAVRRHVDAYVGGAWEKVHKAIAAADGVEKAVLKAVAMQERWIAADEEMGEALRAAATAAVVPKFRLFYRRHGVAVCLTPGDVSAMIAGLFGGVCSTSTGSSC